MGMTEHEERGPRERDEIAERVAAFRATQERFQQERDAYFATAIEAARSDMRKAERPSFWT